jgi:23S rRNA (adenine2503-C2)-methyltransferase
MSDAEPIRFKEHTSESLHRALAHLGVDARLARRLQAAVMQKVGRVPEQMPEVSRRRLDEVRGATVVPQLECIEKVVSPKDGFAKYLFRGEGEGVFEAVRIPLMHRPGDEKYVICVSSQVGCAMGCVFCATGRMGFRRNLAAWEIVDQVMHVRDDSDHPVRGVVFMGMGEPMLNLDAVLEACERLPEIGITHRRTTISTVGWIPGIERLAESEMPVRLALSVHAADEALRSELMPVNDRFALRDVIEACRAFHERRRRRIFIEYVMLAGVNDRYQQALALARALRAGHESEPSIFKVNLIPFNPSGTEFNGSGRESIAAFRAALESHGIPATVRLTRGRDIAAACGQLAATAA